jgi:hypothetical protein
MSGLPSQMDRRLYEIAALGRDEIRASIERLEENRSQKGRAAYEMFHNQDVPLRERIAFYQLVSGYRTLCADDNVLDCQTLEENKLIQSDVELHENALRLLRKLDPPPSTFQQLCTFLTSAIWPPAH